MSSKREQPIGICRKCQARCYDTALFDTSCPNATIGCTGMLTSAKSFGDWAECALCDGTGKFDGQECSACQKSGWRYMRSRP